MRNINKIIGIIIGINLCFATLFMNVYASVISYPVTGGAILFDTATNKITGYTGSPTDIEIPSSIEGHDVKIIGDRSFMDCKTLQNIIVPNGITEIGIGAFRECDNLIIFIMPDSIIKLWDGVFYGCDSLKTVLLSNSLTSIPRMIFFNCINLINVKIPDNLQVINDSVFYMCRSLQEVRLPKTVNMIYAEAFYGCSKLSAVYFYGDAPALNANIFPSTTNIYYFKGAQYFNTSYWSSYKMVEIDKMTNNFGYITNSDNEIIDTSSVNEGRYNLITSYKNEYDNMSVNYIISIYDGDKLIGTQIDTKSLNAGKTYVFNDSIDIPSGINNLKIKCMMWDGLNTAAPLCNTLII